MVLSRSIASTESATSAGCLWQRGLGGSELAMGAQVLAWPISSLSARTTPEQSKPTSSLLLGSHCRYQCCSSRPGCICGRTADTRPTFLPPISLVASIDEIFQQPQSDSGATAVLKSTNSNAATNNEVQRICPGQPGGSFYTHKGGLYNPIGFALMADALNIPGPGQVFRTRGQLNTLCTQFLSPRLDLSDFLLA